MMTKILVRTSFNCMSFRLKSLNYSFGDVDQAVQLFADTISSQDLLGAKLLILFNKFDLAGAFRANLKREQFLRANDHVLQNRVYHLQYCSAWTGDGVNDGIMWLASVSQ